MVINDKDREQLELYKVSLIRIARTLNGIYADDMTVAERWIAECLVGLGFLEITDSNDLKVYAVPKQWC